MGNRKTFNDFTEQSSINNEDYLIGFNEPIPGGERKFKLSDLRNFVKTNEIVKLSKSGKLPELDPNDPANLDSIVTTEGVPFLSGKIFHVGSSDHTLIEFPNLSEYSDDLTLMCIVVNMTDHKRVELKTENGSPSLNARGVVAYDSGLSDATLSLIHI